MATLVVRIGGNTTDFSRAMNQVKKELGGAEVNFNKLGRNLQKMGSALTKKLTVPLMAIGALGVRSASDFQRAMSSVETVTGAAGSELDQLESIARRWGRNSVFNATQVAEAMELMALAGMNTTQIYAALPSVLKLAQSAKMGVADVVPIVASALNNFNLEATEAGRVTDLLATANKNAPASVADLGGALTNVSALAGEFGFTLEDTVAVLATMADGGRVGASAGTLLSNAFRDLARACNEGNEQLKALGISFFDADGTARPLRNIMDDLRRTMGGLTDSQMQYNLSQIVGIQGMNALLPIIGSTEEAWVGHNDAMAEAEGATARYAAIMQDNLYSSFKMFKNIMNDVAISIGQVLLPHLQNLMVFLSGLATRLAEFLYYNPRIAATAVYFGAVVAAVGPLLIAIGKLVVAYGKFKVSLAKFKVAIKTSKILMGLKTGLMNVYGASVLVAKGNMTVLTAIKKLATLAKAAFNKVLMANPFVAIAAAIIAVITGLVMLVGRLREGNAEARAFREETDRLVGSANKLAESTRSSADAFSDQQSTMRASHQVANDHMRSLLDLNNAQELTEAQQRSMVTNVDLLNNSVEGLNLSIDEQTGYLNMSNEAIQAVVTSMQEQEAQANKLDRITEIAIEQYEARAAYLELEERIAEATARHADAGIFSRGRYRDQLEELTEAQYNLSNAYAELGEEHYSVLSGMEESQERLAEANAELSDSAREMLGEHRYVFEGMSESQQEVINTLTDRWAMYRDHGRQMFSDLNVATKLYAYTTDESGQQVRTSLQETGATHDEVMEAMIENMRRNREASENWSNNLDTIAAATSDEFAQHMREMGIESAFYVDAMANGNVELVQEMYAEWQRASDTATNNLSSTLGDGSSDVVSIVDAMGRETSSIMSDFANEFPDFGRDIMSGLSDGIRGQQRELDGTLTDVSQGGQDAFRRDNGINSPSRVYRGLGVNLIQGLSQGIRAQLSQIVNDMQSVGAQAMSGLNRGLINNQGAVMATANRIANDVARTMRNALDINSPSRVMMSIGDSAGEGLEIGLESSISGISDTLARMTTAITSHDYSLDATSISAVGVANMSDDNSAAVVTHNNCGMFDGANFYVRSDDDIRKIGERLEWTLNRGRSALT